ncbi:MAG: ferrous iron transport protein B, ferrous iron transport protein B [Candidatus Peregrinibacteria bacterium GW2011_GWF2_38_29]|nr:MAG: ferrous iron transport protein B, ferrous iron transport protein B [Candidatus Peregrinibacteria bacterium GW2011_GWF2_38_29]HBB02170.1 ferrous iron transport protein B [Candidatus Peregrinibacteria bacterium]
MKQHKQQQIDKILLNKFFGLPIFFFIMWLIFQAIFTIGSIPMNMIDKGVSLIQKYLATILPHAWWSGMIIDGAIGGIGAMLVFIPLIILLFFFLSILQQTGYLNRASLLFNSTLKRIGLKGESIVPLIMGYGCNVPAIMATRNLKTQREKLITTMMIPFLSCSATLPIFTLLIAAFFEEKWRGTALFGLYLLGILFAFLTGAVFNKILAGKILAGPSELPKYKFPELKTVCKAIWQPVKNFTLKAGKIILPFSILIWVLFSFPQANGIPPTIQESYAGKISMIIEPIFKPIGFDWRIVTGLFGALGAKEVFISTFGILYSIETNSEQGLIHAFQNDPTFNPFIAVILLVFILLYSPCIPVISIIKHQFGTRWAIISFLYPTALAWIVCFLIYQIGIRI